MDIRRKTHCVKVGKTKIGGANPIVIQTMTNTSTLDTEETVAQIERCVKAGAEIVRMTTQGIAHAANLENIRKRLNDKGVEVDLVADVHFNSAVAFEAAKHVEKVRINPGNFVDPGRVFKKIEYTDQQYGEELGRLRETFVRFLDCCREYGTAVRLGVNHGSLSDRIMSRYGDTPAGMVESVMEFLRIAKDERFDDIVISIKASNVLVMTETVHLLVKEMEKAGMSYPLHLGVTEAGDGEDGRVKSALGIGSLLAEGIGDTIRVSLSEDPAAEIPVARAIVKHVEKLRRGEKYAEIVDTGKPVATTLPRPFVVGADVKDAVGKVIRVIYPAEMDADDVTVAASIDVGRLLLAGEDVDGIEIVAPGISEENRGQLGLTILQGSRRRMTRTEFIACPGCGRTMFDLSGTLKAVREALGNIKGLKIGVMGCIVNGPGEMADADYGYVGGSKGCVSLYRGKECVVKNIKTEEALDALIKLIKEDGRLDGC